jgi:ribosomal protein L11 methylase PrmA
MMNNADIEVSSFRDPSGFIFYKNNIIYRQINNHYKAEYEHLMNSGLYQKLVTENLLMSHKEVNVKPVLPNKSFKIIEPKRISFISYPYEWSFTQLKDAALLTLKIEKIALEFDMTLKDASSYNIQFVDDRPIFIDTLSFEKYHEGEGWKAYKQFCQHFVGPLALMSHTDIRLNQLFRVHIDGIPVDLTSKLLPFRTRFMFSLLSHIHLHAKSQKHYEGKNTNKKIKMNKRSFVGLIESLRSGIEKTKWNIDKTEWGDYYSETNYSDSSLIEKKNIISKMIDSVNPKQVWDLGANTGLFSRLSSKKKIFTVSFDVDPAAVEKNYLDIKKNNDKNILPLILDLTNPSSNIGWANEERKSFVQRGPADLILALALIHHLVISNNVPLSKLADFFHRNCNNLIIEFIPKSDSQVQRLLSTREDIFDEYDKENFEKYFKQYFNIVEIKNIEGSQRILYQMQKLTNEHKI